MDEESGMQVGIGAKCLRPANRARAQAMVGESALERVCEPLVSRDPSEDIANRILENHTL